MLDEDRTKLAHTLGMKLAEIIDAAEVPDADPPAVVVRTHDGQLTLVTADGATSRWVGPMPGEPIAIDADDADEELDDPPVGAGDDPDAVPDGNAETVLAWVGEDRDRATRALQAEQAGKKRSTLTAQLEKLANLA